MKPFVLEVGVEELPPFEIRSIEKQFLEAFLKLLDEENFKYEGVRAFSTPRRFAVFFRKLSYKGEDRFVEVVGPPKDVVEKQPKALEGFMKKQGIEEIYEVERKGKIYLAGKKYVPGIELPKLLERIEGIISGMHLSKRMRWLAYQKSTFIRPVRWILCLYGSEVLDVKIFGVRSDRYTYGNRLLSGRIAVEDAEAYERTLKENFVIPSYDERYDFMLKEIDEAKGNYQAYYDEKLYEENCNLVEFPQAVVGKFESKYLELPPKVVVVAMKAHQRYIALFDKGKLTNSFIAIINNLKKNAKHILPNLEKVLKARLEDAKFYFDNDTKLPFESYKEKLKEIVWHEELGSMYDKVERVKALALHIGRKLGAKMDVLERACELYKNDLATMMIRDGKEFTELEGYIASEYARFSGESEEVVQAIYDYTLMEEPKSLEGSILALSDRLDTLVGLWLIGYRIKGSYDPLGFKRTLYEIFQVILGRSISLNLEEVVEFSVSLYKRSGNVHELLEFILRKLEDYLQEKENIRYDTVDAVVHSGMKDIYEIYLRAMFLEDFRKKESAKFERIVEGQKRIRNILKTSDIPENPSEELFENEYERKLYQANLNYRAKLESCIGSRDFACAMDILYEMSLLLDEFFNNVFVMVDDEKLRMNRLALLKQSKRLFDSFADFSYISLS